MIFKVFAIVGWITLYRTFFFGLMLADEELCNWRTSEMLSWSYLSGSAVFIESFWSIVSICSADSSCLYDRLNYALFDALGLGVFSGALPSIFGLRATSILLILLSFSKMDCSMIWELTLVRSTGILPNFLFESFVPPKESYYKLVSEFSFVGTPSLPPY